MFGNLIESSSHKTDHARRGSFFLGTLTIYALIFLAIGVGSIYAYDTHIDNQNLELVALVTPVDAPEVEAPRRNTVPAPSAGARNKAPMSMRTQIIAPTTNPLKVPKGTSSAPETVAPFTTGLPPVIGTRNVDFGGGGGGKQGSGGPLGGYDIASSNTRDVDTLVTEPPPPVIKKATPPARTKSLGVVNGMATELPRPAYSAIAKAAGARGVVTVQVLIDEDGKVISARALSGHPLLQRESVQAAYRARFTPTLLSKQPVKVSGVITYNFVMQ